MNHANRLKSAFEPKDQPFLYEGFDEALTCNCCGDESHNALEFRGCTVALCMDCLVSLGVTICEYLDEHDDDPCDDPEHGCPDDADACEAEDWEGWDDDSWDSVVD